MRKRGGGWGGRLRSTDSDAPHGSEAWLLQLRRRLRSRRPGAGRRLWAGPTRIRRDPAEATAGAEGRTQTEPQSGKKGLWLLAWLARFCSISHFGSFMLFSIFYAAWLRTRRATAAPAQFGFARFQISPLGCRWHHPDLVCSTDLNPKPNTATGGCAQPVQPWAFPWVRASKASGVRI